MLVRDRMTSPAITIEPETPFQDALKLMREHKFRRLPVVDSHGKMVGIVSEGDLLHAAPSPATSLSVWEVNYLLWKLKVKDVMTEKVVSVELDTPIEDAAQLMLTKKIGGLPVVDRDHHVIGVITETDIFRAFTELLGGGESCLRLMVRVPEGKGTLAKLTQAIYESGGNIISVGSFSGDNSMHRNLLVKMRGVSKETIVEKIKSLGDEVLDAREV